MTTDTESPATAAKSESSHASDSGPYASPTGSPIDIAPVDSATIRINYALFAGITLAGCLLDLWTKSLVFDWLGPPSGVQNIYWLIEGYVGIETALNHGAVFGLGQGKVWFFALMSLVALSGILYWLSKGNAVRDRLLTVTLGVITGGILGNLYDRLGLWSSFKTYAVRDWIRFSYGEHVWPNFNIADSLLVIGAGLLVWHSFRNPDVLNQAQPTNSD